MRRAVPFNVVAAFPPAADGAVEAVGRLTGSGIPQSAITVHRPGDVETADEIAELEAEMQDELNAAGWGPTSGPQASTAVVGVLLFGLAGVALGIVAGAVWASFASGTARLLRLAISAGVWGVAGATVGLVVGGARLDRRHGEELDTGLQPEVAERDLVVAVHLDDRMAAERAATVLRELGAKRVHLVDGDGIPLPPQATRPRPADPDGFWWTNAGQG